MTQASNPISAFLEGFSSPWRGLRHMNAHPRLWRHGMLPVLCNLLLSSLLFVGLIYGWFWARDWLDRVFPENPWWLALEILSVVLVAAVELLLAAAAWIVFQGIFCGYFYSRLAREVELQLGMRAEDICEVPLWYQIRDALHDLLSLSLTLAGCLVLGWVPLIGPPLALATGAYFDCMVFGMDYLDYPQALRARDRKAQRTFARAHRMHTLGLGCSVLLLSFIPLLSPVLLTTAATGAVLLHRKLEKSEPRSA